MRFDSLGNCGCALTDLVYTHSHTHTRTRTHTHAHAHTHTHTNTRIRTRTHAHARAHTQTHTHTHTHTHAHARTHTPVSRPLVVGQPPLVPPFHQLREKQRKGWQLTFASYQGLSSSSRWASTSCLPFQCQWDCNWPAGAVQRHT